MYPTDLLTAVELPLSGLPANVIGVHVINETAYVHLYSLILFLEPTNELLQPSLMCIDR